MRPTGPTEFEPTEPALSPAEREELTCLAFLLTELNRLRDRGLLPEASHATAVAETRARREAIQTRGRYQALMEAARRLAAHDPRAAAERTALARQADPSRREAWELELNLRRRLREDADALALCAEAAGQFPGFPSPDDLRREIEARAPEVVDVVAEARAALDRGDDERVVALCTAKLAEQPDHFDATVLLAFACQRLNRLDEALTHYRRLRELQPENAAWSRWVDTVERRLAARPAAARTMREAAAPAAPVELAPVSTLGPAAPGISWKAVAGEFLQDHWQKLILCLAVLLIVVSSNVGAYQLLGPRLWSPVGKCVLALVYTAMFAGLGAGLVRWGAERAGRIMLLTTLIVIPANFMLAGEMKLLTAPTPFGLAVLGLDAAALYGLIRVVSASLKLPRGAGFLSALLFGISAFNAAAAPDSPWPWSVQFAVFLTPAFLLLGAEVWLTTRLQEAEFPDRRETTYFALGLLTFAFLSGLVRTGVFALRLEPTLYAVPGGIL